MESTEAAEATEPVEVTGVAEFCEAPGMKTMEVTIRVEEERDSDRNTNRRVP